MAKNALVIPILSFCIALSTGCSISPTYTRDNIKNVIEKICQEEFQIEVHVSDTADTLWIYAPFTNLTDEEGNYQEATVESIRNIFLSLKRSILSMSNPPKFYVFVASDIKNVGIDIYQIGFTPDMIKFELNYISQHDYYERVVYYPTENPEALGDTTGDHLSMGSLTMENFITYLALQKIQETYLSDKYKDSIQINEVDGKYHDKVISLTADISALDDETKIPDVFLEMKNAITKFLRIYGEFDLDVLLIEIHDVAGGKKRSYTPRALLED